MSEPELYDNAGVWDMARALADIPDPEALQASMARGIKARGLEPPFFILGRVLVDLPVKDAAYFRDPVTGEQTLSIGVEPTKVLFVGDLATLVILRCAAYCPRMMDIVAQWETDAITWSITERGARAARAQAMGLDGGDAEDGEEA